MQDSPRAAGDRGEELDHTRARIEELRQRSAELEERNLELARHAGPGSSSPEHVRRAADRAEQAQAKAIEAHGRAAAAYRRSAAAHEAAAQSHEHLAATGFGDVEEHRRRALEHHAMSEADLLAGSFELPAPPTPAQRTLSGDPGNEVPGQV